MVVVLWLQASSGDHLCDENVLLHITVKFKVPLLVGPDIHSDRQGSPVETNA